MENPKVVRMSSSQELDTLNVSKVALYEATYKMEEALKQNDQEAFKRAEAEVIRLFKLYGLSK